MSYLPKLPYSEQRRQSQILQFRGTNLTDNYPLGSVRDSENITTDRFPYIASRNARKLVPGHYNNWSVALYEWNGLVTIENRPGYGYANLYIDGELVYDPDSLLARDTDKQFAVVNTKLIIWPDKAYVDMTESPMTIRSLGCKATVTGVTFDKDANTITITSGDISGFKLNDVVLISGCTATDNNKYVRIYDVTGNVITIDDAYSVLNESGAETSITLTRGIPDLDYICASENRLWGCSNSTQTIYASSLGDPTNFYTFSGVTTDSYVIPVGTDDEFTGCAAYSSSVLFFKEEQMHKMLGSNPTQYQLYTYTMEGVKKGCYKSICNINETLFYVGLHGVYAYSGGTAQKISTALGDIDATKAVAGTDGEKYYLSIRKGATDWNLWVYSLKTGLWIREDDFGAVDFARDGDKLYAIKFYSDAEGGPVYLMDGGEPIDKDTPWSLTFTPFYETVAGSYNAQSSIFAKKRYGRMHLRVELPKDSYIVASVRMDDGRWNEAGRIVGQASGVYMMTVPIKTCDKCELKLEGKGSFCILNMQRFYTIGSER